MNEQPASTPPTGQDESAEEVFNRIQRRRGMLSATDADILSDGKPGIDKAEDTEDVEGDTTRRAQAARHDVSSRHDIDQDQTDTMIKRHHHDDTHSLLPLRISESVWDDDGDYIDMDPGFPRSRTFQTLVRHPQLALAVAAPVAYLALRSAAIRRTAFQVGKFAAKQQLWKQVRRFTG